MHPMTIEEFYLSTLKEAGVEPRPTDLNKIAEAKGVSVEIVKLAKAFYEQLQLDDVPYEDEKLRAVDSMKMAEAYFGHIEETKTAAVETADGLLRYLEHAAEGYCAHHQIPLDGREALKVAGYQAESAQVYEKENSKVATIPIGPAGAPAAHISTAMPSNVAGMFGYHTTDDLMSAGMKAKVFQPHHTVHDAVAWANRDPSFNSTPASGPGLGAWAGRNKGLLGLGALGLGGAYLWHKKNQEEKEDRRDRQMSALRAAALPGA